MKNDYEIRGDITAIFINHGEHRLETIINTSDLEKAMKFPNSWYAVEDKKNETFYVNGCLPRNGKKRVNMRLHRWLFDNPSGFVIDHINHNTLDNTRSNLRKVTNAQNQQNRRGASKSNKHSCVRGVYWHKNDKLWNVIVTVDRVRHHFGAFKDLKEAEKQAIEARKNLMPFSTN